MPRKKTLEFDIEPYSESKTTLKLQKPLYHGTRCKNLPKIKEEGLKVNYGSTQWAEEDFEDTDEPKLTDRGVYLTEDFETAVYFAQKRAIDSDDICVVQVNCITKNTKIGSDGWGEKMTDNDIPLQCLTFYEPKDIFTKLNDSHINSVEDLYNYFS